MFPLELDPHVSDRQASDARDSEPIDYETVFAEIAARLSQDDVDQAVAADARSLGFASTSVKVASPAAAITAARRLHDNDVNVGIGFCLRTVREDFRVPPLWPDAETAWDHGGVFGRTRHHETDPMKFPRGTVGYAVNDRHGHVWLNVGGGLCWSTDFRRAGFVDLAPISKMAPWIGGRLVGWAEILNGFDVWPGDVKKPDPPFGLLDREKLVHAALEKSIARNASKRRIDGLRAWDQKLLARLDASTDK